MIILIYITLILAINAKKKFDPLSVRPRTFDKHIYCMGCQAIIRETLKEIKQSRSEVLIEDALRYAYISRTVESGCTVFIGGWRDQLSEHLMKRESNESIEDEFCVQYTKACFEIDPLEVQKYRKEMYQKKQPVLMDGKYYMPDENGYVDKTRDMVDL
ncbi:unnamed protein product (macronuclear) [Paramecium tetraurelia]|uniref:Saposin B-type domain-containing protein n=1 Tax=Paramecium tetraurelia TaxID=5888 RepID=A0CZB8_PARTE|nr:uncharacterized protein GSPATT00011708001 [Paramecium tetraurelia]CAK76135.1 unnamed protein product [Paramecium tetraurelia]|eukprot:XP_001443532.1 hypothetical protein (macronuclear) [Paramecium tetraurelia strain d4-2]